MTTIRVEGDQFTDVKTLTRDELVQLKDQLQIECADIDDQLMRYKADYQVRGVRGDMDWFQKATRARKLKGQDLSRIQDEFGFRKRQEKAESIEMKRLGIGTTPKQFAPSPFLSHFLKAAKELLNTATFDAIVAEAEARKELDEEDSL